MIISHQFHYLFIEMPLTASWAIHHELCNHYGGEPILHKHASYPEFRQIASAAEKDYFVFATVRNPLDVVVSQYFKLKNDHKGAFSKPESAHDFLVDYSDLKKYQFIQKYDASFADFFCKYFRRPYGDLIDYSADRLDIVIRYEYLQDDFARLLQKFGLDQIRPIPSSNKTQGKKGHWQSYYTPEIIGQAKRVFGPYMKRWGYTFPDEWGSHQVHWVDEWKYRALNSVRRVYVNRFKYSGGTTAKLVRSLRASIR
jgi:hypothetical protein